MGNGFLWTVDKLYNGLCELGNKIKNGIRDFVNSKAFKYICIGAFIIIVGTIVGIALVKSGAGIFLLSKLGSLFGGGAGGSGALGSGKLFFFGAFKASLNSFLTSKLAFKTALTIGVPAGIYYGAKNIPFNFNNLNPFSNYSQNLNASYNYNKKGNNTINDLNEQINQENLNDIDNIIENNSEAEDQNKFKYEYLLPLGGAPLLNTKDEKEDKNKKKIKANINKK